ncbi:unnamed protein product [Psylliodes chrysocephalus]|uniref:Methyltransferase type 11 domain-containing protein n=1 Tax=Psylliodes chrysocephalus TaxID=3402493 RepID=A0A9P0CTZ5_9CUCU|nr:unnamed protein product [Psylliodes chrysocephala]
MSFILPELWSKSSNAAFVLNTSHLSKYRHLLKWNKNASILEFGFANGHNSNQLLRPILPNDYKEFIGSDISIEMVEDATKHFRIPRSKIVQMDIAGDIPKDYHNRFDHVFCFITMHLVKSPRRAFKNIYQILKPGGWTFLNIFERSPLDEVFEKLSKNPKWSDYGQDEIISKYYYSENPQNEYRRDINAANFKDYHFNVEKDIYNFESIEEFNSLFTAANPTIPKIPKELLDEYMAYYLKECQNCKMIDVTTNKDGKKCAQLNTTMFVVHATKL